MTAYAVSVLQKQIIDNMSALDMCGSYSMCSAMLWGCRKYAVRMP